MPYGDPKCRRARFTKTCGRLRSEHRADGGCPNGCGRFLAQAPARRRASASMSADEVEWMADVCAALLGNTDLQGFRKLATRAAIGGVSRQVRAMRKSLSDRQGGAN